jgi:hypothetical protein
MRATSRLEVAPTAKIATPIAAGCASAAQLTVETAFTTRAARRQRRFGSWSSDAAEFDLCAARVRVDRTGLKETNH